MELERPEAFREAFVWRRSVHPPLWTVNAAGERCLEITVKAPGRPVRKYQPLSDETAVWMQFAEIAQAPDTATKEARMAQFAEAYGPLGFSPVAFAVQERALDWAWESQTLAAAHALWRMAFRDSSLDRLREHLQQHPMYSRYDWLNADAWKESEESVEDAAVGVASRAIGGVVNEAFQRHNVGFGLGLDRGARRLQIDVFATNLIGAIWLLFARAIDGDKRYHQCEYCRKFFEVGSNLSARSDSRFCRPTCRAGAHRRLKLAIVQLHAQGIPIKEIARRTGRKDSQIKEWIKP